MSRHGTSGWRGQRGGSRPNTPLCFRTLLASHPKAPWDLLLWWPPQGPSWAPTWPTSPGSLEKSSSQEEEKFGAVMSHGLDGAWIFFFFFPFLGPLPRHMEIPS